MIPRNSRCLGQNLRGDDLQSCILFIFLLKQLIMKRGLLSIYLLIATLFLGNVSSAQNVILGSGTAISVFSPINRTNDYCVYEVIYLQSQIALPGTISTIGFQRFDGTNTDSIENVRIYLKHTNLSQIAAGTYDTTGYTQVFAGSFPNDAGAGWREVALSTPFVYDNVNNLQVLVVKDYQPAIANTPVTPRWLYTNISPSPVRARRYYGSAPITVSTSLTTTSFTSNARLTFLSTGVVEIGDLEAHVYPNPSNSLVNFEIPVTDDDLFLLVTNQLGQTIKTKSVLPGTTTALQFDTPGIYFYRLISKNNKQQSAGKFVVTE